MNIRILKFAGSALMNLGLETAVATGAGYLIALGKGGFYVLSGKMKRDIEFEQKELELQRKNEELINLKTKKAKKASQRDLSKEL